MDICTIIAKNYVAQARVLARSFFEYHRAGRCFVLIIDEFDDYLDPATEPFEVLTPQHVACEDFVEMALRYNVLELSTAVKPWLLRHLLRERTSTITYLDPDIQVYAPLDRLDGLASEHGVVLTPHNTAPLPEDGERPTQVDILLAGVYNLGYLSLAAGDQTDRILSWWEKRLLTDCRVDPSNGYFVDQRWFDLAPALASDHTIVREPEFNTAYWNLPTRAFSHDGIQYLVDGRPLAFFHFSGFDPESPETLSRHQSRISLDSNPALARICKEYAAEVIAAGYAKAKTWPYTYQHLPVGVEFTRQLRKLYAVADEQGAAVGSPFTREGCESFMRWLATPAPGAPAGVNRLLADVYGTREDVQQRFPDVGGADHKEFLCWAKRSAVIEHPMLALLPSGNGGQREGTSASNGLQEASRQHKRPSTAELTLVPESALGVNVVGYFQSEHGVGEAARQVVAALDAADVPLLPVHSAMRPLSRQEHDFVQLAPEKAEFPINLICINADMLPTFAAQAGEDFFANRYSIGLWFWEVTSFPANWLSSFALVDEVWAPTAYVADALASIATVPISTVRIPVEVPMIVPRSRQALGLPEGFCFLFIFDYLSVFERKNPLAVVEAFSRAFPSGGGPKLVIKCMNAEHDAPNHQRLIAATEGCSDIHVINGYLSANDKNALMATCDCYVSLHRSEGFGLTMAEAMFLGKPVIATGYSGNMDFMNSENGLLVNHRVVPIGRGAPPYPPDSEWADPDVEHAAKLMRSVWGDRDASAALGVRAAEAIRVTHSPAAAGGLMSQRLNDLRSHPALVATRQGGKRVATIGDELASRLARGPNENEGAHTNVVRRTARGGALRLMRPFSSYQQGVNSAVAESLEAVAGEVGALRAQLVESNAQISARLRAHDHLKPLPAVVGAQSHAAAEINQLLTETSAWIERVDSRVGSLEAAHALQSDRNMYTALAALSERYGLLTEGGGESRGSGALAPYELRVFSQNGEDGVLAEILSRIGVGERFFVEFGIEDGHEGNCVYLADVAQWAGLFMECGDSHFEDLALKYRASDRVRTVKAMVTPHNVEALFADAEVPPEPSVLSIDVDGADYWIWAAIEEFRPRVVIIEYNSALDPSRQLVQPAELDTPWDGTDYYGASLGALRILGGRKGYRLVHTDLCGVNAFFVRNDLAKEHFVSEHVPMQSCPNYFLRGYAHPPGASGRRYLDLESGELVSV